MDPISVTASALAFATAVKDLVELAQKIHESFAKVSKNRRNAQRIAENIKDMVDEISIFCEDHKDVLVNMKDFVAALDGLLSKLRDFEGSVLPLIPQRGGSLRAITFLRGWWNNNKIEDRILQLEKDIREIRRRYMMKSAMRTEVRQEVNHQDTTRRLEGISQGLEVVRRGVSTICVTNSTGMSSSDSSDPRHIITFAQSSTSTSAPMLRTPDVITEEMWTTAFIKLQLECLSADVAKLSTLRLSGPSHSEGLCVVLSGDFSKDVFHLRREVVRGVMGIRDVLSDTDRLQAISIDDGALQLNNLSSQLSSLGMTDEAIRVRSWAITLRRSLVKVSHNEDTEDRASLAFYLQTQSIALFNHGDLTQSRRMVEEALSIIRTLLSKHETNVEFQGLYISSLLHYAEFAPDDASALKLCIEATQLLEGIFGIQVLTHGDGTDVVNVVHPADDFVDHVFSSSPPLAPVMIDRCADACVSLAESLFSNGHSDSAKCAMLLGVALRREMVAVYGPTHRDSLAFVLSNLCRGDISDCFAETELLEMAEECTLLLHNLAERNPVFYSRHLLRILWMKVEILQRLKRDVDAITTSEDAARLTGKLVQDSTLELDALFRLSLTLYNAKRYLDAVRVMSRIPASFRGNDGSLAALYADISRCLLRRWCYKESAETAQRAVALYRELAFRSPNSQWTSELVHALSLLAKSLVALGNRSQGQVALNESVSMAQNAFNANWDTIPTNANDFVDAIVGQAIVELSLKDKDSGLEVSYSVTQQLGHLSTRHPEDRHILQGLTQAQLSYVYNLYRIGRLQDALQYIDQWLEAPCTGSMWPLANITWIKVKTLDAQGCTEQALSVIHNFRSELTPPLGDYYTVRYAFHEIRLEMSLGNLQNALDIAENVLALTKSSAGGVGARLIWSLFVVAYSALQNGNYHRTIESAHEAIELSHDSEWLADESEDGLSIRPMLFSMMSSAEANMGKLERALNYAQQAVTLSLDTARMAHRVPITTLEISYAQTRGYLAEVLLATGDPDQARQICEERRDYFMKRVKDRLGEYRNLAPILRMLGVLCCHEGRHEEGGAAARELTELIHQLGLVFPSLQAQVKIQLRYQASVPILKVLDEMTEKLDCLHQKGIVALFEV